MAEIQQTGVILADGYDLSPYLKSIEGSAEVEMKDVTAFDNTDGARSFKPGLAERRISGEGFFAFDEVDDVNSIDKFFSESLSASAQTIFSIGTQGGINVGDIAVMLNGIHVSYAVQTTVGEIIMTTFEAAASKDATNSVHYQRGIWLFNQTVTSATNGTSFDNTTGTTGYMAHIHNYAGDNAVDVMIQHSTNNSVWVDLLGAPITLSVGAAVQIYDINDAVNRYVRVQATPGDTTNSVGVSIKLGYTG